MSKTILTIVGIVLALGCLLSLGMLMMVLASSHAVSTLVKFQYALIPIVLGILAFYNFKHLTKM